MTDAKYDLAQSAAITASSSVIGPIIPPSIPLAVYGIMSGQSIAELFMGGFVPGVIIGICLMIITAILALKRPDLFPREPPISFGELITATREASWALLLPVVIIGGILTGFFTPTEAGSVGVLYALVLAISTKTFSAKAFFNAFVITMRSTAAVMIILGAAMSFSWVVTVSQAPQMLVAFVLSVTSSKYVVLLAIGVIVLIMGCFLAGNAVLVILGPMLIAVAPDLGVDLLHLGVFMTIGVMIAVITPPIGGSLFVLSDFTGLTIGQIAKATVPYLVAIVVGWVIVLFVPETVTYLPGLIWKRG
jgi:tripartite ATP-independent transporter DctM subunit